LEIRQATLEDQEAVIRLWKILLDMYNKESPSEVLQRSFRFMLENPQQALIFVIEKDGLVAGTASLHLGHYSTWHDNWYGHIEDLVIDPKYRGQGLAYNLLCHVIEAAKEQELSRIELNALNTNHNARRLYEKLGFITQSVVYELDFN